MTGRQARPRHPKLPVSCSRGDHRRRWIHEGSGSRLSSPRTSDANEQVLRGHGIDTSPAGGLNQIQVARDEHISAGATVCLEMVAIDRAQDADPIQSWRTEIVGGATEIRVDPECSEA